MESENQIFGRLQAAEEARVHLDGVATQLLNQLDARGGTIVEADARLDNLENDRQRLEELASVLNKRIEAVEIATGSPKFDGAGNVDVEARLGDIKNVRQNLEELASTLNKRIEAVEISTGVSADATPRFAESGKSSPGVPVDRSLKGKIEELEAYSAKVETRLRGFLADSEKAKTIRSKLSNHASALEARLAVLEAEKENGPHESDMALHEVAASRMEEKTKKLEELASSIDNRLKTLETSPPVKTQSADVAITTKSANAFLPGAVIARSSELPAKVDDQAYEQINEQRMYNEELAGTIAQKLEYAISAGQMAGQVATGGDSVPKAQYDALQQQLALARQSSEQDRIELQQLQSNPAVSRSMYDAVLLENSSLKEQQASAFQVLEQERREYNALLQEKESLKQQAASALNALDQAQKPMQTLDGTVPKATYDDLMSEYTDYKTRANSAVQALELEKEQLLKQPSAANVLQQYEEFKANAERQFADVNAALEAAQLQASQSQQVVVKLQNELQIASAQVQQPVQVGQPSPNLQPQLEKVTNDLQAAMGLLKEREDEGADAKYTIQLLSQEKEAKNNEIRDLRKQQIALEEAMRIQNDQVQRAEQIAAGLQNAEEEKHARNIEIAELQKRQADLEETLQSERAKLQRAEQAARGVHKNEQESIAALQSDNAGFRDAVGRLEKEKHTLQQKIGAYEAQFGSFKKQSEELQRGMVTAQREAQEAKDNMIKMQSERADNSRLESVNGTVLQLQAENRILKDDLNMMQTRGQDATAELDDIRRQHEMAKKEYELIQQSYMSLEKEFQKLKATQAVPVFSTREPTAVSYPATQPASFVEIDLAQTPVSPVSYANTQPVVVMEPERVQSRFIPVSRGYTGLSGPQRSNVVERPVAAYETLTSSYGPTTYEPLLTTSYDRPKTTYAKAYAILPESSTPVYESNLSFNTGATFSRAGVPNMLRATSTEGVGKNAGSVGVPLQPSRVTGAPPQRAPPQLVTSINQPRSMKMGMPATAYR